MHLTPRRATMGRHLELSGNLLGILYESDDDCNNLSGVSVANTFRFSVELRNTITAESAMIPHIKRDAGGGGAGVPGQDLRDARSKTLEFMWFFGPPIPIVHINVECSADIRQNARSRWRSWRPRSPGGRVGEKRGRQRCGYRQGIHRPRRVRGVGRG